MMRSKWPASFSKVASSEVSAKACAPSLLRIGLLGLGGAEHGDLGAHGGGELHGHVAQAAEAHHADLVALLAVPLAQGRVGGDARAEERRGAGGVEALGHLEDEALVHHDLRGVAAVGGGLAVHLGAVVGEGGALLAELLEVFAARIAVAARVHHAAHAGQVADLELLDVGAHGLHAAHDLVAGHHGEDGAAPLVADLVDVRVADAAVEDVDVHVVRARSRRSMVWGPRGEVAEAAA